MARVTAGAISLEWDDRDYVVEGISDYTLNWQGVARKTFASEADPPYIKLYNQRRRGSFQLVSSGSPPSSWQALKVGVHVRNMDAGALVAWVAPYVLNAATGERSVGRWWRLHPGSSFYEPFSLWAVNPFTGEPWSLDNLFEERFRFGLERNNSFADVKWQGLFAELV